MRPVRHGGADPPAGLNAEGLGGLRWNRFTCSAAVDRGRVETLRSARENGCPWTASTRDRAAEKLGYTDDLGNNLVAALFAKNTAIDAMTRNHGLSSLRVGRQAGAGPAGGGSTAGRAGGR